MSTTTPNMGLVVPEVAVEPGPDWATELNGDLSILDQHNHATGQGVQINPAGININTDLTFLSNNATDLKAVIFTSQGSPITAVSPYLGCLYVVGNELYYNDGAGNQIAITTGGSVNAGPGSITGLPSGTASASYLAGTFTWQQATNTPAVMDMGNLIVRNNSIGSNGITVAPPNSIGTDYNFILPPVNTTGSTVYLTYDTSGNVGLGSSVASVSPSGSIIMFGGAAAPSGYLLCDGTSYLRATYPDLFAAISTAYGTADGTHFNVPDFRGMFPRGVDPINTNDPNSNTRVANNPGGNVGALVGSQQPDQVGPHNHSTTNVNPNAGGSAGGSTWGGGALIVGSSGLTPGTVTGSASNIQTNPINLYVNFIIKT